MQKIKRALRKQRDESQLIEANNGSAYADDSASASTSGTRYEDLNTLRVSSDAPEPTDSTVASTSSTLTGQDRALFAEAVADRNIVAAEASKPPRHDAPSAIDEGVRHLPSHANPATEEVTTALKNINLTATPTTRKVDTTVHQRTAAAVTHETIVPVVQNVRQEVVTREIHAHDIHHRIQPVLDKEILPAKHYLQDAGGRTVEIPASEVPADSTVVASWQTAHWEAHTAGMMSELPADREGPSRQIPTPRKYPKVGKFAKKPNPNTYEGFEQRPGHSPPPPDDGSRILGQSPPKTRFLTAEDRSRARLDKAEGIHSTIDRGHDRSRKPPSIYSMSPSRASSTASIRSKASSLHVREFSEH